MPFENSPDSTRSPTADGEAPLYVRPIDFVAEDAVVRQVGDRSLFLGNVHAADPARCERSFDAVLSLTAEERPATTHHHPLVDGEGNDWATFSAAVDAARRLHRRAGDVLVHCTAGISRGATVLATTIAAEEGVRYSAAIGAVQAARPHAVANPALAELAVVYLAADGDTADEDADTADEDADANPDARRGQ